MVRGANGFTSIDDNAGASTLGPLAFAAGDGSVRAAASPAHVLLPCANAHSTSVNMQGPFRSMDQ
jgi:hypothetical protein